jgi:large subunit ribosomal protein L25
MSQNYKLNVAERAQTGRSASRRLRKANRVPAILYGKHTKPESLSIEGPEFTRLLKSVGGRAVLIQLERSGKADKALSFLQEVQRDPITDKYLHVDLQEVKSDEKFEIQVPVHVVGESFGVKNQSGVLEMASHTLRVRVLPKDLPEQIVVDVSALAVGPAIQIGQIQAPAGVTILGDKHLRVFAVSAPVTEAEAAPAAAEGAEAKQPEMIKEKKEEAAPAAAAKKK